MRSPLEILSGRFDHALLTTYSFNLRFFERWVLRALWAADVRNVILFVDDLQLGNALIDKAPSFAGSAYHLVSARTSKGAFHPKVILVAGEDGARLCVSSANLTAAGQMRNSESAIAFDSHLDGHARPIHDAGELFRDLSQETPAHTKAAIEMALKDLPAGESEGPYRLLHNLNAPLIDSFPEGMSVTAVAPYVDARGTAAEAVHDRAPLKVIVDGEEIAAGPEFFSGPWDIEARKFDARLHGKSYEVESPEGRWVLVGSPNLTQPALLRTAADGNLEVAVAMEGGEALELPASKPWAGSDLALASAQRLSHEAEERDSAEPDAKSFDAWEEGEFIAVSGLPDGAMIERLENQNWIEIGVVANGVVEIDNPRARPARVRATTTDGKYWFAVVARPVQLRDRAQAATRGRQTQAVQSLPLDLEMARVLEGTLSELSALADQIGKAASRNEVGPGSPGETPGDEISETLVDWRPRSPDEEPRVPPLYMGKWSGEPDAFLALVGRLFRSDPQDHATPKVEISYEAIGLDQLDEVVGAEAEVEQEAPETELASRELDRYRKVFNRVFGRGIGEIGSLSDPLIAGVWFITLARLVEDLGSATAKVGAVEQPMMERGPLRRISLDLLAAYLQRNERDPLCLATARAHLATAIRKRHLFSALDRERIDSLAYKWASVLVEVSVEIPSPPESKVGLHAGMASLLLREYAERSLWTEISKEGADRLADGRLEEDPWPLLVGRADLEGRVQSPAWSLLAFEAPAGYRAMKPFGVVVFDSAESPLTIHALICVPASKLIIEVWRRRNDGIWVERSYSVASQAMVENLNNSVGLEVSEPGTERSNFDDLSGHVQELKSILLPASVS